MSLIISHASALELFERCRCERRDVSRRLFLPASVAAGPRLDDAGGALARARSPRAEDVERALSLTGLALPLHVMVASAGERFCCEGVRCHVWRGTLPDAALTCLAPGIYACMPTVALAQMAEGTDIVSLALAMSMTCGTFARGTDGTLACNLTRACTIAEVVRYGEHLAAEKIRGARRLLDAAGMAVEGANSPAESRAAMMLATSRRRGGFGLSGLSLNQVVELNERGARILGRQTMRPDILLPSGDACEFDSKTWHASELAHERDALRREALSASGYSPHTITSGLAHDLRGFSMLAAELARRQGTRCRPPSEGMLEARADLHERLFPRGAVPGFGGHAQG